MRRWWSKVYSPQFNALQWTSERYCNKPSQIISTKCTNNVKLTSNEYGASQPILMSMSILRIALQCSVYMSMYVNDYRYVEYLAMLDAFEKDIPLRDQETHRTYLLLENHKVLCCDWLQSNLTYCVRLICIRVWPIHIHWWEKNCRCFETLCIDVRQWFVSCSMCVHVYYSEIACRETCVVE